MFALLKKKYKPPAFQPERDWRWLLAGALICIIILLAIYAWLNYRLNHYPENLSPSTDTDASGTVTLPELNRAEIQRHSDELAAREKRFQEILNAPEKVSDPSL